MQPQPGTWPVQSGAVPPLAPGYTWRPETGQGPWDGLHPGHTVVLRPQSQSQAAGRRMGGTGKTQLAAAFALQLWEAAELDLLVWVDAGSRDAIITAYARALADIAVAAPPGQPEAAADRFLAWLAETRQRWLVVLDGLADAIDADGLWPAGPAGEVLVTTDLTGLRVGQAAISVGGFSPREALEYLSTRLNDDPFQSAGSLDLAIAVDCLPIALTLAVTYLLDIGGDCRQYRLANARYGPDQAEGTATDPLRPGWMLAVGRARQFAPAELAWPAMQLACVLGPAGIPGAVLTSVSACGYATGRPAVDATDQAAMRTAFGNLGRFGLVSIDQNDTVRTVRISAALAASVRQAMTAAEIRRAVRVAADALCEVWPDGQASPAKAELEQGLRDCATSIRRCDARALWDTECHPLLLRIGQSLDEAPMPLTALDHWRELTGRCAEALGVRAPLTLQLRERLASAAATAGRLDEAIGWREELIRDLDRVVGPNHRLAITARASLVAVLQAADRFGDAILLGERVAADCDLVLGATDPQTSEALISLGRAYQDFQRYPEAVGAYGQVLGLREKVLGLMHALTVAVRHQLAEAYRLGDHPAEAIGLYQAALTQSENTVGATHPDTVTAREHLAVAFFKAGQTAQAATTLERALAEWDRLPWVTPADTITARASLAAVYCQVGRAKEAIPLFESEITDLAKLRGPEHAETLRARWNLAAAFHRARRLPDATRAGEETLADCERLLGAGHRETLTARANLANAYQAAGQLKLASAQFDLALQDCELALGPGDELTEAVRALRKRALTGRQGAAPIITPPVALSAWLSCRNERVPAYPGNRRAGRARPAVRRAGEGTGASLGRQLRRRVRALHGLGLGDGPARGRPLRGPDRRLQAGLPGRDARHCRGRRAGPARCARDQRADRSHVRGQGQGGDQRPPGSWPAAR